MSRLLALDLSSNVGAARFNGRARPRFETLKLEGPDLTFKLGGFQVWLEQQYRDDPFDALAYERPLLMPTDTVDLLRLLYGLVGICLGFIGALRLEGINLLWREVDVPTAKKAITGNAKATKEQMLYAANRTLNWRVTNDHEADAGAVGVVAFDQLWPKAKAAA